MKPTFQLLSVVLGLLVMVACGGAERANDNESGARLSRDVVTALSELTAGGGDPGRELAGLAVAVLRNGEPSFEASFGRAYIDPAGQDDRPLTPDTLIRVASISKILSAVVVMQLAEEGVLDLDRDVSEYLGWQLRNPHYLDRAITLRHLLSHVSSIRDAGESYIIRYPRALQEAFDPNAPEYGERFQVAEDGRDRGPGVFYEYCNLNFGVVGTILEKVSGQRFDRLMHERFYAPLGITGGFNAAELSASEQQGMATLYRKRDEQEMWHPGGAWIPQADDPTAGVPTALPADADYEPGTNGAQFSPQGGARLSLHGMETLARLLLGDGSVGETRLLAPESMAELRRPVWRYDPAAQNLEGYRGWPNARATGLRIITGETAGDRLFPGDTRSWLGHFGEAYGLMAGVWVQPESGEAVIYAITGTAFDPSAEDDGTSTLSPIEARVVEQLGRMLPR